MKKILIISPYFPPYNTPDLQRIRMSLPYYHQFNWEVEVLTVENPDRDTPKDDLLTKSVPKHTVVHYIKTFSKKITSKFGLGSVALRSLYFYKKKGNELLKTGSYDLVFFSTTQFAVCILGAYWKRKFNIPYVIDMQDPWHSDYYKDKPKSQQPRKYWFSYHLNKFLEPIAMKSVDGLMAVSKKYISDLKLRYPNINNIPNAVITFAYSDVDYQIAKTLPPPEAKNNRINLVYVGVLGIMMHKSLTLFFDAVKKIEKFSTNYHLSFQGTSYANANQAAKTALSIAHQKGLSNIDEDTQRLGIFEMLNVIANADGLIIFGTDEAGYTSSKLYPYLQSNKPILGIFHPKSDAISILATVTNAQIITFSDDEKRVTQKVLSYLQQIDNQSYIINKELFNHFSALETTKRQCELFNSVIAQA